MANLTGQNIKDTYQELVTLGANDTITDGTGSLIEVLAVTASNATSAGSSNTAISASYATFATTAGAATTTATASYTPNALVTGSVSSNVLTFTKGDGSAFNLTVATGSAVSASYADYAAQAGNAANADQAELVEIFGASNNSNYRVMFATSNGFQKPYIDTEALGFYYNPSTNALAGLNSITATSFIGNASTATSASHAVNSDFAISASYAANVPATASYALEALSSSYALNSDNAVSASYATNALSASYAPFVDPTLQSVLTAGNTANTDVNITDSSTAKIQLRADGRVLSLFSLDDSGTNRIEFLDSSEINNAEITFTPSQADLDIRAGGYIALQNIKYPNIDGANGQTLVTNGTGQLSFSSTVPSASYAETLGGLPSGSYAILNVNNNFTGTQTFDNIAVNGTGSFAYIQSVTGSAKIIGDAFIILNNNTPAERFAGVVVQDSGSTGVTASLEFDGLYNDWFYEYSNDGGVTTDHGVALFGPTYSTKGTPIYPVANQLQKGTGGHHLTGSNISDDGSVVSISTALTVTGSVKAHLGAFQGDLVGTANSASIAYTVKVTPEGGALTYKVPFVAPLGQDNKDFYQDSVTSRFVYVPAESRLKGLTALESTQITGSLNGNADTATSASFATTALSASYAPFTTPTLQSVTDAGASTSNTITVSGGTVADIKIQPSSPAGIVMTSIDDSSQMRIDFEDSSQINTAQILFNPSTGDFVITSPGLMQIQQNYYPGSDGTAGQAMVTNGSGQLSFSSTVPSASYAANVGLVNGAGSNSLVSAASLTATAATANGVSGIALGNNAKNYADYAVVIGDGAQNYDSARTNSVYIGRNANGAQNSVGIGYGASVLSDSSVGVGRDASVTANNGIAIGYNARATDGGLSLQGGIAIGRNTLIDTTDGINIGNKFWFNSGSNGIIELRDDVLISGSLDVTTLDVAGASSFSGTTTVAKVINGIEDLTISSLTASMDCSNGNMFRVTLDAGNDCHIVPSNLSAGQTVILQITQADTSPGTYSFAPSVKFPGGTAPTATATLEAIDTITFVSFNGTAFLASANQDFS